VDKNDGEQRPGPQKEEICQSTEDGSIRKLEDGARNGGHQGCLRVGDAEFVKVMDVGKAEDDGR
jgi:hypothetical protein